MPLVCIDLIGIIASNLHTIQICACCMLTEMLLKLTWHVLQEDELKDAPVKHGGVLTPASAMGMVLVRRLQDSCMSFRVQ